MRQRETKKKGSDDKARQELRHQPELSTHSLPPEHSAQPAGYLTGEFQPVMWEQRDMMTSLHKTLQSLLKPTQPHSVTGTFNLQRNSQAARTMTPKERCVCDLVSCGGERTLTLF